MRRLIQFASYSNYFIALCTVALCVETAFQHNLPLNNAGFYGCIFFSCAAFYTSIYLKNINSFLVDDRLDWYRRHKYIKKLQTLNFIGAGIGFLLFAGNWSVIDFELSLINYFTVLFITLLALLYAFSLIPVYKNLRSIGFAKPFILGFTWAGVVTLFPVVALQMESKISGNIFQHVSMWLFLKNFMFISVLCIMFDLKDIDTDKRTHVKTYSVLLGINKTITFIIIPLIIAGIVSFIIFTYINHFPAARILFNASPYVFLLLVTLSLHKNKPLLYYLFVVDGLMILKAICGILGAQLIK